ncbi:NADPH-dependent oxidoreductase [Mycobacterium yunnanensis]|uniref:NADPH-dependent oxidoreductase n=1 Tax=Mycobacterium yunnanensis TaxID=368477 RepID=A0A9X3BTK6_9MYCO|nr:NADPH-dependent oxidoreductase [Mycobacterium yunnanensis]MCV7421759.1 NADPH-dependent oxidoreductase [Mycobacterium yunnanensis]
MTIISRYGDPDAALAVHNETIALQLAHRSVRKFTARPVTDEQLAAVVAAAQSAATSSNLQAWSVIAVRDPDRKARLAALANGQQFINESSVFLVWVVDLSRARRLADRAGTPLDGTDYLETTIIGFVDTALAAQNAVIAAESLGLGTVYVGAMRNHPEEVAAELALPPRAVAAFGLAIGSPDPSENAGIKPRLPREAVLHREQYRSEVADAYLPAYDERLAAYNTRFGLPGNWSERVVTRLAGPQSLSGRHRLRDQLARLGLPSR